jgi:protein-tyrosine phosphatase
VRRLIDLEGCLNFRDLGGYPTDDGRRLRWRRLYRSDALDQLTQTDVARLRGELGVRDVIDLRSSAERRLAGPGRLADGPIRVHHVPLFDGEVVARQDFGAAATLGDRYALLAEYAGAAIARVLEIVAAADGPAVYHCAAGKDRTGVVSAVILGLLGVRDEVIVADYVATRENLDALVDRLLASEGYQAMLAALPPDTMHAEPETMLGLLARLRAQHGSVRAYALAAGASADTLARLEAGLLEP